ncbi:thiamine-phosphate kinase [Phycicoccus endophyticus]|uniref:Thiamine-monophosphate kinase n=1 Tax=Phycicoccus endophyticus TaxID=1690220 RepID=A0A7G9QYB3_9MICO|nr:thiamine-phosphate kinase [Phycicoccus endophyticus]NHI19229.1 thiamine-phosphate kinase [Phycicoccus endophyticus]QNN48338.1 thiamine-phosphate kinase [Phycicoccus endophyticus]GGL41154.1 thiamine-monophosphate kinase [Phycicoccus endophyticus]
MERLRDLDEAGVLQRVLPLYGAAGPAVAVGPGDDAAVIATPSGSVVATTDGMVRGRDWRDEWSSGHDVGVKVAVQNIADVAAVGAVPTGLLVALVADPALEVAWARDLAAGIAEAARDAGAAVVGGDLSSGPPGVVVVTVTALGDLQGREPVLRSGARPGDVVAVCGSLGHSGGGLALLLRSGPSALEWAGAGLVRYHLAPRPPWESGPLAAAAGASALVDVSDGLATDLGHIARASGVRVDLDGTVLREELAAGPLTEALGAQEAWNQVLTGGEEHSLVACFPAGTDVRALPGERWRVIGRVAEAGPDGPVVTVDGAVTHARGWDHFTPP